MTPTQKLLEQISRDPNLTVIVVSNGAAKPRLTDRELFGWKTSTPWPSTPARPLQATR